ncbi:mannonate dehydratase [Anopheles sinensis]|uniref:Mannonate dehydratase n=1 Tax=Anopheles sinensis TaxID=74873 RepID=A0A084VN49_ANOSI|nr:mannonate dehydratase [Anopheles sinensis]
MSLAPHSTGGPPSLKSSAEKWAEPTGIDCCPRPSSRRPGTEAGAWLHCTFLRANLRSGRAVRRKWPNWLAWRPQGFAVLASTKPTVQIFRQRHSLASVEAEPPRFRVSAFGIPGRPASRLNASRCSDHAGRSGCASRVASGTESERVPNPRYYAQIFDKLNYRHRRWSGQLDNAATDCQATSLHRIVELSRSILGRDASDSASGLVVIQ